MILDDSIGVVSVQRNLGNQMDEFCAESRCDVTRSQDSNGRLTYRYAANLQTLPPALRCCRRQCRAGHVALIM